MKKTHFAITLLELSTLINQSRAIVTKNRFKVFDSSTPESIINDELYVSAMFAELPIANYFEQQAFFVLRLVKEPKHLASSIANSSLYEVYIADIETVLPVTKEGKNIVIQSNNLPGISLGEPLFESIWNDFFWNRHANLALCIALEYADEYFLSVSNETKVMQARIKQLIILNDSKSKRPSQDLFIEFLRETLKYRRDLEKYKNDYGNESPFFHISDLLACASLINTEIKAKCRQTYLILKAEDSKIKSLSYFLIHDEINSIIAELITLFNCEKHHILGVLLFLWIRLAKQNGKCRSLSDIKGIIESLNTFDQESTRFALILIGLSEPQESLIQFIHSTKKSSYGIFSASPQKQIDKNLLFSEEFFNNVYQGLPDLKKTCTPDAELKSDDVFLTKNTEVAEVTLSSENPKSIVLDAIITVSPEIEVEITNTTSDRSKEQEALSQLDGNKSSIPDDDLSKLNLLVDLSSDTQNPSSETDSPNTLEKESHPMEPDLNLQGVSSSPDSIVVSELISVSSADKDGLT